MTSSGCGSFHKDTYDYDEYIAIKYVLNPLDNGITEYQRVWYLLLKKAIYIIQLDKTICISLKTVGGVHLSIVGTLFTLI